MKYNMPYASIFTIAEHNVNVMILLSRRALIPLWLSI